MFFHRILRKDRLTLRILLFLFYKKMVLFSKEIRYLHEVTNITHELNYYMQTIYK